VKTTGCIWEIDLPVRTGLVTRTGPKWFEGTCGLVVRTRPAAEPTGVSLLYKAPSRAAPSIEDLTIWNPAQTTHLMSRFLGA
jgi:hypothetical protein